MKFLLILLIAVAVIAVLRLRRVLSDRWQSDRAAGNAPEGHFQPPGTRDLDEETAARPEIAASSLAAARATVSSEIPDEVLRDVLLDATPQQATKLFAAVPQEVMAGAIGQQSSGVHFQGQAQPGDLANLSNLSSAVDDLDIWSFAESKSKSAS